MHPKLCAESYSAPKIMRGSAQCVQPAAMWCWRNGGARHSFLRVEDWRDQLFRVRGFTGISNAGVGSISSSSIYYFTREVPTD